MPQRDLYQKLRAEAIATRARMASMLRRLNPSQVGEHPEPAGWSVGQVLEHLLIADDLIDKPLTALLAGARRDAGAPAREWKPSFIGGLIAKGLLGSKPLRGPKVFRPGPTPRNGVVDELLARELTFVSRMADASTYDWRALRIGSPALPSWAPKMNLGDGFRIHVVHLTRHSKQVERLVGQL